MTREDDILSTLNGRDVVDEQLGIKSHMLAPIDPEAGEENDGENDGDDAPDRP